MAENHSSASLPTPVSSPPVVCADGKEQSTLEETAKAVPEEDLVKNENPHNDEKAPSEVGSDWSDAMAEEKRLKDLVAEWKFLDFEHYKNRYGPDEGLEIIEVLRGHKNLGQEIVREEQDRGPHHPIPGDRKWEAKSRSFLKGIKTDYIENIRIQSPAILLLLSRITGHQDSWAIDRPRVFYRPFRALYYFLPQVKEALQRLEKRWGDCQSATPTGDEQHTQDGDTKETLDRSADKSDNESDAGSVDSGAPEEVDFDYVLSGDITNSLVALQHIRKYVEFVEKHVVPQWTQGAKRKFSFPDLWIAYRPGEVLYEAPWDHKGRDKYPARWVDEALPSDRVYPATKAWQTVWRLYSMFMGPVDESDNKAAKRRLCLQLFCYFIDFDGTSYQPCQQVYVIDEFEGEKDITQLPLYPLRFASEEKKLRETLRKQGELFHFAKSERYLFYDGWTLTQGPIANPGKTPEIISEHIESNVMVDFVEGYRVPELNSPTFSGLFRFINDNIWQEGNDGLQIRCWSGTDRTSLVTYIQEATQDGEYYGNFLRSRHMKESRFMREWTLGHVTKLDPDDLILLPRRVVAYAFRERKFILADVHSLREIPKQDDVFQDLMIDPQHKQMIESLVNTHFQKQDVRREFGAVNLDQDLIRSKGSGLIILLHGVPGVGKTATAEAIAQINSKPLFTITCGDLGYTPYQVDSSLRNIFRLAHLWDCVLLLDEADVFLSHRELHNLQRNALVSVFLRVLEYYSGILFLTTNRVGHLDEAFRSRIHVSLYYPPLTRDQTVAIFGVNIRNLKRIEDEKQELMQKEGSAIDKRPRMIIDEKGLIKYAKWHWNEHKPSERWNGRQIRNAFQIAYSLAHWPNKKPRVDKLGRVVSHDGQPPSRPHPAVKRVLAPKSGTQDPGRALAKPFKLDYTHFEEIAKVIENFDAYLYSTLAGTAADSARLSSTRADDYDPTSLEYSRFRPPEQQQRGGQAQFYPRETSPRSMGDRPRFTPGGGAYSGSRPPREKTSGRPRFQPGPGTPGPGRGGRGQRPPVPRRGAAKSDGSRARVSAEAASRWPDEGGRDEAGDWDLNPQDNMTYSDDNEADYYGSDGRGGGNHLGENTGYDFEEEYGEQEEDKEEQEHYGEEDLVED